MIGVDKMSIELLGEQLAEYCNNYKIPIEYVFDILEDQKVVPMIRGKATEYTTYLMLKSLLNPHEWSVEKLNLNAQAGQHDEDVSVTHQRTGIIIKVECKNASRGSFKYSKRCKIKDPHCTIKCHKSRSNISKASTTNDKYLVDDFDIVVSNLSNAVIAGGTYTEDFELIENEELIDKLASHYKCGKDFASLFEATYNDWRFAKSVDLAKDGIIPRTPYVNLYGGDEWHPISELETALSNIVREQIQAKKHRTKSRR